MKSKTLFSFIVMALVILYMIMFPAPAHCQNAKLSSDGNYIAVSKATTIGKPTGKTYTDTKGVVYPVYITSTSKLYVIKTSKKTNKEYKSYLKL